MFNAFYGIDDWLERFDSKELSFPGFTVEDIPLKTKTKNNK